MYDPQLGRFLQRDRLVHIGLGSQGWNRYAYANNNPTTLVDPSGNVPLLPILAAVWAVAELGLSVADAVSTAQTLLDTGATTEEKLLSAGLFAAGVVGSGGGYSSAAGAWRLVGANRAVINPRKLTDYALNPNHPVGGDKARVFQAARGYNESNYQGLLEQVRRGVMEYQPIAGKVDQHGARFTVDILVTGPAGEAIVRTGWIYDSGSTTPRLTTLYVKD